MTPNTRSIQVSQHFTSSPETVFDGWMTAAIARQFLFSTEHGVMVRAEIDPRVGGILTFVDQRDGEDVLHTGTYLELVRPTRIKFTFSVPRYSPDSVEVTLDLKAEGTGTNVVLTQSGTHPEYEQRTIDGWRKILQHAATVINEINS